MVTTISESSTLPLRRKTWRLPPNHQKEKQPHHQEPEKKRRHSPIHTRNMRGQDPRASNKRCPNPGTRSKSFPLAQAGQLRRTRKYQLRTHQCESGTEQQMSAKL
eukprot:TRINITY_DN770_c0_g5_i1.p1 TRINITY_DN770_c0_g5~~TRINITY_DN770_c0_g5_i1.p1  ORF type:complete len:105 (+),score=9.39 TRINITY_DN770_c0_g5_i1:705-1019(+)